jgi:TonB family protein
VRHSVIVLVLAAAAFGQANQGSAPIRIVPRVTSQPLMSPEQEAAAEAAVRANPEDVLTRMRLLAQYAAAVSADPGTRFARLQHILYMIEHHPDTIDATSGLFYVFRAGGPYADAADHDSARNLWMREADAHPADSRVVLNAARFLFVEDKQDAEQLLRRAVDGDPGNQRLGANLGFLYGMDVLGLDSASGEIAATIPAAEREQARQRATGELENSANPAVLAGAATAIPNLAMRASAGRPVDPQLFEFASKLMAKARTLAPPSDEAFRGPMPMIQYFQEAQRAAGQTHTGLPLPPNAGGAQPGVTVGVLSAAPGNATAPAIPQRIRISADVQKAKLIRAPQPAYPEQAREAGIEGNVRFAAVIARDGAILSLQTLGGHPLLVQAALDAVKQWVYQPTLLNGEPVEVATEIVVSFPSK